MHFTPNAGSPKSGGPPSRCKLRSFLMHSKLYKCCALVLSLAAVESLTPPCGSPVGMEDRAKAVVSDVCADTTDGECADGASSMRTNKYTNSSGVVLAHQSTRPRSDEGGTPAGGSLGGTSLDYELESPPGLVAPRTPCACSSPFCFDQLLASPPFDSGVDGGSSLDADPGGGEAEVAEAMQVLRRHNVSLPQIAATWLRQSAADHGVDRTTDEAPPRATASTESNAVRALGDRKSDEHQYQKRTSQVALAAARAGIMDSGDAHIASRCPLARTLPAGTEPCACHVDAFRAMRCDTEARLESEVGLELWEVAFNQTRRDFMAMSSSSRGRHLFALLSGWYTWDKAAQAMKQHYFVAGREVCRCIFLLVYPVEKTVDRVVAAVKSGNSAYYVRDLEGSEQPRLARGDGASTTSEAASWLLAWAENEGERIPGPEFAGRLYVPRIDVTGLQREINELRTECGITTPLKYGVVHKAWTQHPSIAHIRVHRDKRNFQQCSICVNLRALLRAARQRGDAQRSCELQAELRTHRLLQRTERERYYFRRAMSCQPNSQSLSLIFDKWSSWTTIVPWFARSPGAPWRDVKDSVLQLHVMLVRIHGKPNSNYFFSANDSIQCGGNFTIETVIRPPPLPSVHKSHTPLTYCLLPPLLRSGARSHSICRGHHCPRRCMSFRTAGRSALSSCTTWAAW